MAKQEKRKMNKTEVKGFIALIITLILGFLAGWQIDITMLRPDTTETVEKTVEVTIDTGGALEFGATDEPVQVEEPVNVLLDQEDIKTVETVDGGKIESFAGRGAFYRTDTFEHFVEDTLNKCVSEGNPFGAQCVSLAQAYWTSYAGYGIDLCGTGAARGIWDCRVKNADDSFVMITDPTAIQPGDWIITDGGTWGHVAMAVGYYNNGYIAVYGENQGGVLCAEGGSQPNVINLSMKTFLGAFRPVDYIIPEPEPEPTPDAPDTGASK